MVEPGTTEVVKRYSNGEITVVWKPAICMHSKACFTALPAVFDPSRRPWIDVKAEPTEAIVAQVNRCPSGALSLESEQAPDTLRQSSVAHVQVTPNGPLLLQGPVEIKDAAGHIVRRDTVTALCRCGGSNNKPYCDGSHQKIGFRG